MTTANVLILYFSRTGHTAHMAEQIAIGVEQTANVNAIIRTVPNVSPNHEATEAPIPEQGPPHVSLSDLSQCDGLILGSATRFGNMAGALKHFLDTTGGIWMEGALINKPAGCFTSTGSLHGGQETTLLSMMLPLIHQGMIMVGSPYSDSTLMNTTSGGTPYGPSHWAGAKGEKELSADEKTLCIAFGKRIASIAHIMKNNAIT